ncbi:TPA: hypothetical protein EYP66_15110 [Candidatus Poribacteria bacterium]|nr:hypothetical protein [Candidatus Poribacteria bacterium]
MIEHLDSIQLTDDEMPVPARLSSSRPILSPTSPAEPECLAGFCDRWWIDNRPGKNVAIHYWIFDSPKDADLAAVKGRRYISARSIYIDGKWESVYQPETELEGMFGDKTFSWQNNILFVKSNVLVLVSEPGQQVELETIRSIARKIEAKLDAVLKKDS